jgi:hypothetical protein
MNDRLMMKLIGRMSPRERRAVNFALAQQRRLRSVRMWIGRPHPEGWQMAGTMTFRVELADVVKATAPSSAEPVVPQPRDEP